MNILFTTNDKFVPQVCACMCSVFENNKKMKDITIYIFSNEISGDNMKKLVKFGEKYKRKVEMIEIGDVSQYFDFDFDTNGWNPIVLARLLLDKLLPEKVDKILYLDGDTIVRDSLEKLWNKDLKGCVLGACVEPTVPKARKESLGLAGGLYFNAGVLLVDLKKWRETNAGKRIIQYYKEHDGRLFAGDQDAISAALKNEIFVLSPRYNFYNIYTNYPYKMFVNLMKPSRYVTRDVYEYAVDHPAIIHYLGEERPWRNGNLHVYREDFDHYLSMTPYADMEREEGWNTYFNCFYLFHKVLKPFPVMRYKIINGLIPVFMKFRKSQLKKEKKMANRD